MEGLSPLTLKSILKIKLIFYYLPLPDQANGLK